jgi:hypothetical protein
MSLLTTSRFNGRPPARTRPEPVADDSPDPPALALVRLLPAVARHPELDTETMAYHLRQSDATAADEYWHASINEARSFLEALVMSIALARDDGIVQFRKGRESTSSFRLAYRYLHTTHFLDDEEELLLQRVYGLASAKGAHHGVTDAAWCHLARQFVATTGEYLLQRYVTWTRQRALRAIDRHAEAERRPRARSLAHRCRVRLQRILRMAMPQPDSPIRKTDHTAP